MKKTPIRIAVTGAAGNIAYSLIFRLAAGELFKDEPIALHLLDLPDFVPQMEGVKMELQDCAFPLLSEVIVGSDPYYVFEGVDCAFLIGAKPRGPGMERKDLLMENAKIFKVQGKALNDVASSDLVALIVGNPCNTNCLIAIHNAPKLSPYCFSAMTRLDQNRSRAYLAEKAKVSIDNVSPLIIWGNHSTTMVPDFVHTTIDEKPVVEIIDRAWLENDFQKKVQNRGAEIIKVRGKSSVASAANAALDAMKSFVAPGEIFSSGILSDHNPYGIEPDLVFSFPLLLKSYGKPEIVPGYVWDQFFKDKIALTQKELIEERDAIRDLL